MDVIAWALADQYCSLDAASLSSSMVAGPLNEARSSAALFLLRTSTLDRS